MNNVLAKISVNKEQLKHKLSLGFNMFEVQLLTKDDYKNTDIIGSYEDMTIVGVHTPLIDGRDLSLEEITDNAESYNMFIGTCLFAQKAANYYDRRVYVVIHNSLSCMQYKKLQPLARSISFILKYVSEAYPDIDICIENVSPIDADNEFRNSCNILDVYNTAAYFNNLLGHNLMYVCFDTCHHMMFKKHLDLLDSCTERELDSNCTKFYVTYSQIFTECKNLLKVVHLSNLKDYGLCPETHGTAFEDSEKDMKLLTEISEAYLTSGSYAWLALEVREDDYMNVRNLPVTYKNLNKVFNNIHTGILAEY